MSLFRKKGLKRGLAENLRALADVIGWEDALCPLDMRIRVVKYKGHVLEVGPAEDDQRGFQVWRRREWPPITTIYDE